MVFTIIRSAYANFKPTRKIRQFVEKASTTSSEATPAANASLLDSQHSAISIVY